MKTLTADVRAVPGRRISFVYLRDMELPDAPAYPGVITGTEPGHDTLLALIRLDGSRSTLRIPVGYEGLTYGDEIGDVPALPMGRFTPTLDQLEGAWEGVPICSLGEDGDVIALTDDHQQAVAAMAVYRRDMAGCLYNPDSDGVDADAVRAFWAVFEWEPEDSEMPWTVQWGDEFEGQDQAIRIHYLPA
ncbi:hypothetical protein [Streptomyces pseudovenezuelae]|uniref:hypothetical protein n=1 Tax=Streptomyces pseudovenezuelae TaxID=67350 RepID=UPI002E81564D|nr:hypothetical protein [Streptomyces pseudovenezuelae]WUA94509.1 hypothetical protein OHO81_44855 [Streptomyces pseudovenezuelae]